MKEKRYLQDLLSTIFLLSPESQPKQEEGMEGPNDC